MPTKNNPSVTTGLDAVFYSIYTLYWKTHTCHWNIIAPDFYSLHEMFKSQYTFLWNTLDEIAERYRALELTAPTQSRAVDADISLLERDKLIKALLKENESVMKIIRESIETFDDLDDMTTEDFLIGLLATLEKHSWMLRSSVGVSKTGSTN